MRKEVFSCLSADPDFEIRDGIVYVTAGEWAMCTPLRIAVRALPRLAATIAEYEARRAEVHRLPVQQRG